MDGQGGPDDTDQPRLLKQSGKFWSPLLTWPRSADCYLPQRPLEMRTSDVENIRASLCDESKSLRRDIVVRVGIDHDSKVSLLFSTRHEPRSGNRKLRLQQRREEYIRPVSKEHVSPSIPSYINLPVGWDQSQDKLVAYLSTHCKLDKGRAVPVNEAKLPRYTMREIADIVGERFPALIGNHRLEVSLLSILRSRLMRS